MSRSSEKLAELKQFIHDHLLQVDVRGHVEKVLRDVLDGKQVHKAPLNEADILEEIVSRGLVEEVLESLRVGLYGEPEHGSNKPIAETVNKETANSAAPSPQKGSLDPARRHLYLHVVSGKAFLEHLQQPFSFHGQSSSTFTLHVHYCGQRFRSRPVACACEPDFGEGFLLELHNDALGDGAKMADTTTLLGMCDPVHMVLVSTNPSGEDTLVASHNLEWRHLLTRPASRSNTAIELTGIGRESKIPVGVLEVRLELIPSLTQTLDEDLLSTQLGLERSRSAESERLFLVYAKEWWREYLQVRESHSSRLVKIFAQDETASHRPVCTYLWPLTAGRLLDTPRQAARFVSLIPYEKTSSVGADDSVELWASPHAFLARRRGDCENHALLLCGLLLGFGLDAYVCLGTKTKGAPHAWVMTLGLDGQVIFWESLTANRYRASAVVFVRAPAVHVVVSSPLVIINIYYRRYYYNARVNTRLSLPRASSCPPQPSDRVEMCDFTLPNESRWKPMSSDAIRSLPAPPGWTALPLRPPVLDVRLVAADLELQLQALVAEVRRDQGLSTHWDTQLSYLLTPALAAYEMERSTGVTAGNEEFQHAIRGAVPEGHVFKGFPIQFMHRNARRIYANSLKAEKCQEVVSCRGDHVRLAIRVRVFSYPEDVCAVWVMYACTYRSVV
ncbi:PREDICTED: centrosomal protein of 76 kDa-like [Priapulus caudatus]|uniref:Centrosomal protein of 76 kDa n=1 Tax=Priapulus caudatus TaxID=37621 RepID=A0ABM1EFF5_PRICU|nr:PREDICTED: centrosomal protein of 76 kDa-like [Priapulus caudatus]